MVFVTVFGRSDNLSAYFFEQVCEPAERFFQAARNSVFEALKSAFTSATTEIDEIKPPFQAAAYPHQAQMDKIVTTGKRGQAPFAPGYNSKPKAFAFKAWQEIRRIQANTWRIVTP